MPVNVVAKTRTNQKPNSVSRKGIDTFMPQKLAIMVGIARRIVMDARNFITMLRLLEMTEAKASIMLLKMLEYISTISMACLFSMMTSSRRSSSSSNILIRCCIWRLERRRRSFSITMPFERREELKKVKPFCSSRSWKNSSFFMDWRSWRSISSDRRVICWRYFKNKVADL